MVKKLFRILIVTLVSFIVLHVVFLKVDYYQIKNEKKPIFALKTAVANDGGSIRYTGFF